MQCPAKVQNKKITWQEIPIMFNRIMVLPDVYDEVWSALIPFALILQVDHRDSPLKFLDCICGFKESGLHPKISWFDPAQKRDPDQHEYDLPPFAEVRQKLFSLTPWFALC